MRPLRSQSVVAACLALAAALSPAPAVAEQSHLLIVVGLGGEPEAADAFHAWALALKSAAEKRLGVPASNVTYLGERPERDPAQIAGRSTREGVEQALAALAARAGPGDLVMVVLIGHGSFRSGDARFNLPGPDLTAQDFARLAARFAAQKLVFVNTASSSGEFQAALAGPNRVVVTATRSGMERNQTRFAGHFVAAFGEDGADADKDGRVSLQEAFDYARREVQRDYEKGNQLLTEHAVLEDGSDGGLARRLFLGPAAGASVAEAAPADPALAPLVKERRELEEKVERLKALKQALPPADYDAQLEAVLLELALKGEQIRAAAKRPK